MSKLVVLLKARDFIEILILVVQSPVPEPFVLSKDTRLMVKSWLLK